MLAVSSVSPGWLLFFFFFNDTATTEIYTLSLHDALPIYSYKTGAATYTDSVTKTQYTIGSGGVRIGLGIGPALAISDRKSTRLNSSHSQISYAVFCLKKKNTPTIYTSIIAIVAV